MEDEMIFYFKKTAFDDTEWYRTFAFLPKPVKAVYKNGKVKTTVAWFRFIEKKFASHWVDEQGVSYRLPGSKYHFELSDRGILILWYIPIFVALGLILDWIF